MSEPKPLHRLFGMSWIDFFQGTTVEVETERDLSVKQQFVDLVIIRKDAAPIPRRLPDGFEDLAAHNLVTFKSHQEAFDEWAMWELIGHYVNYRKQSSPSMRDLLPTSNYRLFAVSARMPRQLFSESNVTVVREGVYEFRLITLPIRVIVLNQLPEQEQNAMLLLFSTRKDSIKYGAEHYRPQSQEISTVLHRLFKAFKEDANMARTVPELYEQYIDEMIAAVSPEKRLKGMAAEERLKGMPAEERLKGLTAEELLRAMPPEIKELLTRQLMANGSSH